MTQKIVLAFLCSFICILSHAQKRTFVINNQNFEIDVLKLIDLMYLPFDIEERTDIVVEDIGDNGKICNIITESPNNGKKYFMNNIDKNLAVIFALFREDGFGEKSVRDDILKIIRFAANNLKSVKAMYFLGNWLHFYKKDYSTLKEGAEWIKKAAEEGDINAITDLSTLYKKGFPWGKDNMLAEKYLLQACSFPSSCAFYQTGLFYDETGDLKKAEKYYKQCINTKHEQKFRSSACYNLAIIYENQKRKRDAFEMFKKGALLNDEICGGIYGYYLYIYGHNVDGKPSEEDKREGLRYLKIAADAGHTWSQMKYYDIISKNK